MSFEDVMATCQSLADGDRCARGSRRRALAAAVGNRSPARDRGGAARRDRGRGRGRPRRAQSATTDDGGCNHSPRREPCGRPAGRTRRDAGLDLHRPCDPRRLGSRLDDGSAADRRRAARVRRFHVGARRRDRRRVARGRGRRCVAQRQDRRRRRVGAVARAGARERGAGRARRTHHDPSSERGRHRRRSTSSTACGCRRSSSARPHSRTRCPHSSARPGPAVGSCSAASCRRPIRSPQATAALRTFAVAAPISMPSARIELLEKVGCTAVHAVPRMGPNPIELIVGQKA